MLKRTLILAALLAFPAQSFAVEAVRGKAVLRNISQSVCFNANGTTPGAACTAPILDGVALNATASARTLTLPLDQKFNRVKVTIELTRSAATTLDATVSGTLGGGSTAAEIQSGAISSGVRTLSDLSDSKTVAGSVNIITEFDVAGLDSLELVFSGTSGGGSDLIDVYAVAISD